MIEGRGPSELSHIYDVLIVGAGPCGLAVASRLCEHTPSAIFTDEEHHRYYWIKKHGKRMSLKNKKNGTITLATRDQSERFTSTRGPRKYSTVVLDATADAWMAQWNRLFKAFEISHLRSPMFFHVDPSDRDALLAHTHEQGKSDELREIQNCVGKEISKHKQKRRTKACPKDRRKAEVTVDERDRKDYYVPSQALFSGHCQCIIDRYGLKDFVHKEAVMDIDFGVVQGISGLDPVFTVKTNQTIRYAKAVVLALGAGGLPVDADGRVCVNSEGSCHSLQMNKFPPPGLEAKIRTGKVTNMVVVGGGLTSAQIVDLALRRGVSKVWQLIRSDLRVKPFDVDLAWVGKFKNHAKAEFWSAENDEERLARILDARGGGSITKPFHQILKRYMATGKLSLHAHTKLASRTWSDTSKSWAIETHPPIPNLPSIDYICFATGIKTDYRTLPLLKTMNEKFPIHGHGGFPCVTEDLMWREGIPLFVTGKLAALRIGPGAANLEGARLGAERVSWALEDILNDAECELGEQVEDDEYHSEFVNRYSLLHNHVSTKESNS